MRCELCSQENRIADHSLCASCVEMVQRLVALKNQLRRPESRNTSKSSGGAMAAGLPR